MFRASRLFLSVVLTGSLVLSACASTDTGEDNNNTQQNNNNTVVQPDGGPSTGCAATCTQPGYTCVGIPDHQSCVPECESGMVCSDSTRACCYGGCVDLQNDPNNCGSCAAYCDGNCINGTCVDLCGNSCGADEACCGGTCTNVSSDVTNCGSCGNICDVETANSCTNGYCTCGAGSACSGGRRCCQSGCKDLNSDVSNCGSCGNACQQGETCNNGTCSCGGGPPCSFGEACCSGSCVSLNSNENCGSCGNACTDGNTCNNGTCNCGGNVCSAGPMGEPGQCCPDGNCVVYNLSDPLQLVTGVPNCGSCGNNCPPMTACLFGTCGGS